MAKIKDRTGETSIATNGMKMTIVKYNGANDIDIQFEDGTIVRNTSYRSFSIGLISHPDHSYKIKDRTGETSIATNGMKMTIVKYRRCDDIDIQFEDGTIVTKKIYNKFREGNIAHPNYSNGKNVQCRIGETSISTNGQKMTIIKYRNYDDIDVQFEDGAIVKHKNYKSFIKSQIGHKLPYQMDNIIIEKLAYIDNIGNFFCHCTKCGKRDIMTISEAKNHQCSESMTG